MRWDVQAVSVVGNDHKRSGTPCQDAHAVHQLKDALILAVADGAGSARFGGMGARSAVRAATSFLAGALTVGGAPLKAVLGGTVLHCRETIEQYAKRTKTKFNDYHTTLSVAVVTPKLIGTIQMGDSGIVMTDGTVFCVETIPQEREFTTDVVFLTSDDYRRELQITVRPRNRQTGIALFSDGIEDLGIHRRTNTAEPSFFGPLFEMLPSREELQEWLSSEDVTNRTGDDKTIVIARQVC